VPRGVGEQVDQHPFEQDRIGPHGRQPVEACHLRDVLGA
jgi:hypothetical protein